MVIYLLNAQKSFSADETLRHQRKGQAECYKAE